MKIKMVVGLGNPGKEYDNTRHNIGFSVIDKIANKLEVYKYKERDGALYFDEFIDMARVIFVKPQKYINLSGDVIIKFKRYLNINTDDILIISDDLDLPVGAIKIKEKGSSGGHNGLKNIEQNLGTTEYKRIKIGISNNKNIDTKDYVLGKLGKEDKKIIDKVTDNVADIVLESFHTPFNELMSKYNVKIKN